MRKKVLITGVNGFLGSSLREYLKTNRLSFKISGIDRHQSSPSRQVFLCNLNNKKEVTKIISRVMPDYIFHLAGGTMNTENDLVRNNVLATRSLFEAISCLDGYCPRIIIPGSAAEYGKTVSGKSPTRETVPAQPISIYGFAKNAQTNLGLMHAKAGLDVIVVRIFNVCGYGMSPTLSLGRFSRQIALIEKSKKRPVIRTRNLGMKRDYLDVKDVCCAFLKVAQKGRSGEIYNVCSGNSYLMRDLLKELIGYSQIKDAVIKEDDERIQGVDISVGSNAKIKKVTGWEPKVSIGQSLKNTLSYYREVVSKG